MSAASRIVMAGVSLAAFLIVVAVLRPWSRRRYDPEGILAGLDPRDRGRIVKALTAGRRVSDPSLARALVRYARMRPPFTRREEAVLMLAFLPVFGMLGAVARFATVADALRVMGLMYLITGAISLGLLHSFTASRAERRTAEAVRLNEDLLARPNGPWSPQRPLASRRTWTILAVLYVGAVADTFLEKGLTRGLVGLGLVLVPWGTIFWWWHRH